MKKIFLFLTITFAIWVSPTAGAQDTLYQCSFDLPGDTAGWSFANYYQSMRWVIGQASNMSSGGLFVTYNGTHNHYGQSGGSVSYAYRRVVLTRLSTSMDADLILPLSIGSDDDVWGLLMSPSRNPQLMPGDRLRIYRLEQQVQGGCPQLEVRCCELCLKQDPRPKPWLADWQFLSVGGRLAVGGADDENVGWAVVLQGKEEADASPQRVLSTCQHYRQFATEKALAAAAESYGNVKMPDSLTSNTPERKCE